jgi:hypothetical protein
LSIGSMTTDLVEARQETRFSISHSKMGPGRPSLRNGARDSRQPLFTSEKEIVAFKRIVWQESISKDNTHRRRETLFVYTNII